MKEVARDTKTGLVSSDQSSLFKLKAISVSFESKETRVVKV